jgi:hypothetical protein
MALYPIVSQSEVEAPNLQSGTGAIDAFDRCVVEHLEPEKPAHTLATAVPLRGLRERSLHHGGVANKAMNGAVFRSLILLSRRGRIKEGS